MPSFLLALAPAAIAATPAPALPDLAEARHAIQAGRLEQARAMVTSAIGAGMKGDPVDRLLADLAFARGENANALARYTALLLAHPNDAKLLEPAAIAALRLGDTAKAEAFAGRATRVPGVSWRAWNTRGAVADLRGDFSAADEFYRQALGLAPDRAEVLNNLGWSRILRGDWQGAVEPLERAVSLMPGSSRAANNLELARSAIDASLPARRSGESGADWAARLNDAGMAAELRGDRARAVAAFARAIEARGSWYERAANNLAAAGGKV